MCPANKPTMLVLPEAAHLNLIQLRDHLRLLSQLTETDTSAGADENQFRADALTWCFSRLARDMEEIVDAMYWTEDVDRATQQ